MATTQKNAKFLHVVKTCTNTKASDGDTEKKNSMGLKEILNSLPPTASPLLEGLYFVSERLMSLVALHLV